MHLRVGRKRGENRRKALLTHRHNCKTESSRASIIAYTTADDSDLDLQERSSLNRVQVIRQLSESL